MLNKQNIQLESVNVTVINTAIKLLLYRAGILHVLYCTVLYCTVLYSRLLARRIYLFDNYSTRTLPAPYKNSLHVRNVAKIFHLRVIANKLSDALTNIIKTSSQYIHKYMFRYSQVFIYTDGQTEGI
jgi:hypothetical protein